MTDPLVVVLPFTPVRALSPNGRVHWRTKRELTWTQRQQAAVATRNVTGGLLWDTPGRLRIGYRVFWERGRKMMDDDNAISCMKAARDGICDALGIDDKRLVTKGITQERDPEGRGFTEVTLTREGS